MNLKRLLTLGLMTIVLAALTAHFAYAVGGYWNPRPGQTYTAKFEDEAHNSVVGAFTQMVEWEWDANGKVTVTKWDAEATFVLTDKSGKTNTVPNAVIQKAILDLQPGFQGTLKGNIAASAK